MTDVSIHLLTTIQGAYKSSLTRLQEESWQVGIRHIFQTSSPDPVGTLPSETDIYPVATSINRDETNWTISGNWRLEAGINDLDVADWLNDQVAPAVIAWIGNSNGLVTPFPSSVFVREINCYPIGSDGKAIPAAPYALGTPVRLVFKSETVADGAGSGNVMPPQTATVLSWRTSQIGAAGRGRIFAPPLDSQGLAAGLMVTNYRNQLATATKTFLEDMQLSNDPIAGIWCNPIVASTIQSGADRVYGPYALINGVRVGDVFDTQRRRRRSITEQYQQLSITNPA